MGSYEGNTYDPGSGHDNAGNDNSNACSSFEFHKGGGVGDRAFHHRPALASLSKPAPSKWDDAQKWLVSLSSGGDHHGYAKNKSKASNALRKLSFPARQTRAPPNSSDVLVVSSSRAATVEEEEEVGLNQEEGETKKIDYDKSLLRTDKPIADPASEHISYVPPPSSVRSVCMRDMGTDMTPIASQEPSRTGTPIRATTPLVRSPASSRPPTPGRSGPPMEATGRYQSGLKDRYELSEKQTRQEIIALGAQLGKTNIAAWASKEEEEGDASKSLKTNDLEQAKWNVLEARAAAWEEAEQAKYMARYKREEVKIQAWENRQKIKAETEMRRIEVKVERMKSHAHERLMNKLAAAQRRAEEKRAAAEAKAGEQAVKTAHTADFIRQTGHMPTSFSSCGFSFFHCGFCH